MVELIPQTGRCDLGPGELCERVEVEPVNNKSDIIENGSGACAGSERGGSEECHNCICWSARKTEDVRSGEDVGAPAMSGRLPLGVLHRSAQGVSLLSPLPSVPFHWNGVGMGHAPTENHSFSTAFQTMSVQQ